MGSLSYTTLLVFNNKTKTETNPERKQEKTKQERLMHIKKQFKLEEIVCWKSKWYNAIKRIDENSLL